MRLRVPAVLSLIALAGAGAAFAHGKKLKVPAAFQTAHTIFVQSENGDASQPQVSDADRAAIQQVTQAVRQWHRYALVDTASRADLVIVVRKGHPAIGADQPGAGLRQSPVAPPGQPGMQPGMQQQSPGANPSMGMPAMPATDFAVRDMLRVYTVNVKGKLKGPIWSQQTDGGLDTPTLRLFQQLKSAVDSTFPQQPQNPPAPAQ